MDIGTGIAIAGIWLFPCACALGKEVDSLGFWAGTFAAIGMTLYITSI